MCRRSLIRTIPPRTFYSDSFPPQNFPSSLPNSHLHRHISKWMNDSRWKKKKKVWGSSDFTQARWAETPIQPVPSHLSLSYLRRWPATQRYSHSPHRTRLKLFPFLSFPLATSSPEFGLSRYGRGACPPTAGRRAAQGPICDKEGVHASQAILVDPWQSNTAPPGPQTSQTRGLGGLHFYKQKQGSAYE